MKKIFFLASAFFFLSAIFANDIEDYAGREIGANYPEWILLLEKIAEKNDFGTIEYSKSAKKLFNKLNLQSDKTIYFSIAKNSNKDMASAQARKNARTLAVPEDSEKEITGLMEVAFFWQREEGGEFKVFVVFAM